MRRPVGSVGDAQRLLLLLLLAGCAKSEDDGPIWTPGLTLPSEAAARRGLTEQRGLIHAHSIFSHDACDGEPVKDGVRNQPCLEDFRAGLCRVGHDFVMLTDHPSDSADVPFREALLADEGLGDVVVERNGEPVAARIQCSDGRQVLLTVGFESDLMPVGLDRALPTRAHYSGLEAEKVQAVHDAGGLALIAHTEDWTAERLLEVGVDGFEMYNLHANTLRSAGVVLELLLMNADPEQYATQLPKHPDLLFLPLFSEDPRYLETWSRYLALGGRGTGTLGTDCHRNSFDVQLTDGERADSYRRMMQWFSNHLLVEGEGPFDDRDLEAALDAGRLYGAFEALGYPEGFDYYAEGSSGVIEMGGEADRAGLTLVVRQPTLRGVDPDRPAPELRTRLLLATEDGFEEVASAQGDLRFSPDRAGAYRAEVRMVPRHLEADLGKFAPEVLSGEMVWIYANPIFVR